MRRKILMENVAYQIHYDGAVFYICTRNALSPRADSRLMYTVDGLVPTVNIISKFSS